jgi:hypothetical protein
MRKHRKAFGPGIVLIWLFTLPLLPATAGNLSGTWNLAVNIGGHHIKGYLVLIQEGIEISGKIQGLDGAAIGWVAGAIDLKNNEAGLGVTLSSGEKLNFYATNIEAETMGGTVTTKDNAGNPIQTRWKAVRIPKTASRQF